MKLPDQWPNNRIDDDNKELAKVMAEKTKALREREAEELKNAKIKRDLLAHNPDSVALDKAVSRHDGHALVAQYRAEEIEDAVEANDLANKEAESVKDNPEALLALLDQAKRDYEEAKNELDAYEAAHLDDAQGKLRLLLRKKQFALIRHDGLEGWRPGPTKV